MSDVTNSHRQADEEARRDLQKPYAILLADAHYELDTKSSDTVRKAGMSMRRLAAIVAKSAIATDDAAAESSRATEENLKLQRKVVLLTVVLTVLTVILTVLTLVQVLYLFRQPANPH